MTICIFLARHASWIAEQPWVDELWADLIFDPLAKDRDREKNKGAEVRTPRHPRPHQSRPLQAPAQRDALRSSRWRCPEDDCDGHLVAAIRDTDALLPSKVSLYQVPS